MGWASGSELADGVWDAVKEHIPEEKKQEVALRIVNLFEGEDCDTLDECEDLYFTARPEERDS
jgi:hypothetical protein